MDPLTAALNTISEMLAIRRAVFQALPPDKQQEEAVKSQALTTAFEDFLTRALAHLKTSLPSPLS